MRSVRSPAQTGTCHRQAISQITPQRVAANATLCIGRKGIAQPFEAVSFEQDAIEAAVTIRLADQVVTGSKDDAPLFSRRDTARCGPVERVVAGTAQLLEQAQLVVRDPFQGLIGEQRGLAVRGHGETTSSS